MKVVFITPVTPYKENMGGPSGHPYHLMIERPENVDIVIYSYNNNNLSNDIIRQVEQELSVEIRLLKQPKWWLLILKLHLTFIRLFLKYPINYYIRLSNEIVREIKSQNPDLVWGYGQEFSGILKQFKEYKRIHTVPDCYSLHFYRRLGKRFSLSNMKEYWRTVINYRKFYRMERDYDDSNNIKYYLVGKEDAEFLKELNPKLNTHFIRHPHYEIAEPQKQVRFSKPKIKLLFAGRYDFYMQQEADELNSQFIIHHSQLKEHFVLTFLGKGWEKPVETLRQAGYDVNHIKFAPDYIEEIRKHDIQITPIAIGTGTKGKVLDALANGLLVIGTTYALENIAVENGVSCIEYKRPMEVIEVLRSIPNNVETYERIAEKGREQVLKSHHRQLIAEKYFKN